MRLAVACITTLLITGQIACASEWKVDRTVDSMTDQASTIVLAASSDGHGVSLKKFHDGTVHLLVLSGRKDATIDPERGFIVRVDKMPAQSFTDALELYNIVRKYTPEADIPRPTANSHVAGMLVWNGLGSPLEKNIISQMLRGEELRFRIYFTDGSDVETAVSLPEGREAIQQLLK